MQYKDFDVELMFTTELLGTVPKDPNVYKTFIESKKTFGKAMFCMRSRHMNGDVTETHRGVLFRNGNE